MIQRIYDAPPPVLELRVEAWLYPDIVIDLPSKLHPLTVKVHAAATLDSSDTDPPGAAVALTAEELDELIEVLQEARGLLR